MRLAALDSNRRGIGVAFAKSDPVHGKQDRLVHSGQTRLGERVCPALFTLVRWRTGTPSGLDRVAHPAVALSLALISGMSGRFLLLALLTVTVLAACSSVPSPTYRDFEVRSVPADSSLTVRLRRAATAAGWTVVGETAQGTVSTAPRPVPGGIIGRTTAALSLTPLNAGASHGARFVRVTVRAEQRGGLGGRSKVYALDSRLREAMLGPVETALAAEGLVALGTPRDRDEDAADG